MGLDGINESGYRIVTRFCQASQRSISWYKAAEADEAVGDAYRKLVTIKQEIDRFEEIPEDFMPLYNTLMKGMSALAEARKSTTNAREMTKRLARGFR